MYFPGAGRQGVHVREVVESIDIMPTVLEYLNVPTPRGLRGRSLWPFISWSHSSLVTLPSGVRLVRRYATAWPSGDQVTDEGSWPAGGGSEKMRATAPRARLVAKANAGIPVWKDGRAVYGADPAAMAVYAGNVAERGAWLIGACCGSTPAHLLAMAEALGESLGSRLPVD